MFNFTYISKNGNVRHTQESYEGVVTNLERRYIETGSGWIRDWIDGYMEESTCPMCKGSRLQSNILNAFLELFISSK